MKETHLSDSFSTIQKPHDTEFNAFHIISKQFNTKSLVACTLLSTALLSTAAFAEIDKTADATEPPAAQSQVVDSDKDSIPDSLEQGVDTDGDGITDDLDVDSDNDGLFDYLEAAKEPVLLVGKDTGEDGSLEGVGFGGRTIVVTSVVDSDGDGIPDFRDTDSDGDGLPDSYEHLIKHPIFKDDMPSIGFLNLTYRVANQSLDLQLLDSDQDGVINSRDLDADNDGLADRIEQGATDIDGDGKIDTLSQTKKFYYRVDTDNDGLPNFIDLDSDQDSMSDISESYGVDANNDGRVDDFIDLNGDGRTDTSAQQITEIIDTDADGVADYLDIDRDGDGVNDVVEAGNVDADNDGRLDAAADSDYDGVPDSIDVNLTGGSDADNDGIDDRYDSTYVDGQDSDGDGIIDDHDPDPFGNGWYNTAKRNEPGLGAALPDSDADGIPDVSDTSNDMANVTLSGPGCTIASNKTPGAVDPTFLALLFVSFIAVFRKFKIHRSKILMLSTWILALPALLASSLLSAENLASDDRSFYIGGGASITKLKPQITGDNFSLKQSRAAGGHALLGYQIDQKWRVEIEYARLGGAKLNPSGKVIYSDINASVLFSPLDIEPLGDAYPVSFFAKVGAGNLSVESTKTAIDLDRSTHLLLGIGATIKLSHKVSVRIDAVSYDKHVNRLGVNLLYHFPPMSKFR